MKYVIVRDDDINYFTKPEWLELLYTPFFEKGIPVSFSVIPYIRTDSVNLNEDNIYHQKTGIKYEPFIQPEFRGRSESFSVNQNQSLIDFMSTHKNNIEILQHGYAHERIKGEKEFRISDIKKLEFRLKKGREIIEKAFNVIPEFFSPPWDSVSAEALSLIKKNYKGISLERYHHSILPVHLWWRFFKKKQQKKSSLFWDDFLLLEHFGTVFSKFKDKNKILFHLQKLMSDHSIIILVNHYWEYFFDWQDVDHEYLLVWNECIQLLLSQKNIRFITFNKLYNILR